MKFLFNNANTSSDNWWRNLGKIGRLYFVRGLPRSGKSTFCENFLHRRNISVKELRYNRNVEVKCDTPTVLVCGDDFRLATHGKPCLFEIDPNACYIHIGTPKSVCLERNKKTKAIPEHVFD